MEVATLYRALNSAERAVQWQASQLASDWSTALCRVYGQTAKPRDLSSVITADAPVSDHLESDPRPGARGDHLPYWSGATAGAGGPGDDPRSAPGRRLDSGRGHRHRSLLSSRWRRRGGPRDRGGTDAGGHARSLARAVYASPGPVTPASARATPWATGGSHGAEPSLSAAPIGPEGGGTDSRDGRDSPLCGG